MSKASVSSQATAFSGMDVSAKTLAVAVQQEGREGFQRREFANSAAGHTQMIAWLLRCGTKVRVSLEATGVYSLDVALALDAAEGIEVAVLNPKTVNRFAETLRRSKTDKADAVALAQYSLRMPFVPWKRPARKALQLLSELAGLDPEMTVRQWVAHSGLDPAHQLSGSSVHKTSRISRHGNRHLRRALYMPALVGVRFDPHRKGFYNLLFMG